MSCCWSSALRLLQACLKLRLSHIAVMVSAPKLLANAARHASKGRRVGWLAGLLYHSSRVLLTLAWLSCIRLRLIFCGAPIHGRPIIHISFSRDGANMQARNALRTSPHAAQCPLSNSFDLRLISGWTAYFALKITGHTSSLPAFSLVGIRYVYTSLTDNHSQNSAATFTTLTGNTQMNHARYLIVSAS